jgi:DNA invertase Pin-like site-specific DNA recombinase
MLVGYARVSTQDQDLALQLDALRGVGCSKVFEEKASGAQRDRPELTAAVDYMREGDTLVVWKLDRLARSLKQLIETVEKFGERGIGLRDVVPSGSCERLLVHPVLDPLRPPAERRSQLI